MMHILQYLVSRFRKEEDGLALTEYLILLGLLTAGVVGAVGVFGGELGDLWDAWAGWITDAPLDPPPATTGG